MKKITLVLLTLLFLSGCAGLPTPAPKVETIYVGGDCPKFTKKLNISIKRLDDNYAKISWDDVQKIKDFGSAKTIFNEDVQKMNTENKKLIYKSLEKNK